MKENLNKAVSLQKQMLGKHLFPLIQRMYPDLARKITGMILEKGNKEILKLIENPVDLTKEVQDAVDTLNKHKKIICFNITSTLLQHYFQ